MAISVTVCVCVRVWSLTTRSKQATPVVLPYPTPWPLIPPCSPQFIKKSQAKRRPKTRSPSLPLSLYLAVSVSSLNLCCVCLHTPSLLSLSLFAASTTCSTYSQHVWAPSLSRLRSAVPLCPLLLLLLLCPFPLPACIACLALFF